MFFDKVSSSNFLLKIFLFSIFAFSFFTQNALAEVHTVKIYSSAGDGTVYTSPYPGVWNNQRDDTVGRAPNYTSTAASVATADSNYVGEYRAIDRAFMSFDTSAIPDNATVTKANLNLYIITALDDFNDAYSYFSLLEGTQVSSSSLVGADIDNCGLLDNPTKGSSDIDVTTVSEEEYLPIDLNSSGLSWISLTSDTKLCMRTGHDIEDSEVVHSGGGSGYTWETTRISFNTSEAPGTSTDPYLEITYEVEDEPEQEEDYILYTQIESPYPSVAETSAWSAEDYANGVEGWCGSTIGECGCVLTSLVMSARNAGIEEDILEGDVNPSNMNSYLESVSGYTSGGYLRWLAAQAYFGEITSGGEIASRFYTKLDNPATDDVMSLIDDKLIAGNHAVLGYKGGHFVWLPEKTLDGYVVNDPWWYDTQNANDDSEGDYIRDYENNFTDTRIIEILDEPAVFGGKDIEVHLKGTAELLFKNEMGDMVGYNEGEILLDLDRASYGNTEVISLDGEEADNGRHLLVYDTGERFTLEVVGTGSGEFSLEFFTINSEGEVMTFNYSGYTVPGLVTTLYFDLETGDITEAEITLEQFLSLLDYELTGFTKQQQAFFKRWTEKVFESLEEKTLSQALRSVETYKKLLSAKKIENPVLISVLDKLGG